MSAFEQLRAERLGPVPVIHPADSLRVPRPASRTPGATSEPGVAVTQEVLERRALLGHSLARIQLDSAASGGARETALQRAVRSGGVLQLAAPLQFVIKPDVYNTQRAALAAAGSKTAEKSHPKHNTDAVPDGHAQSLVDEASDEQQALRTGKNADVKTADAIHAAVKKAKAAFSFI